MKLRALQLDALVAVAHAIPALHRAEHKGEDASSLGADDFLPIFMYVLVNSNVEDLAAQAVILETLCDPKKLMGEAGEYYNCFFLSHQIDRSSATRYRPHELEFPSNRFFHVEKKLRRSIGHGFEFKC